MPAVGVAVSPPIVAVGGTLVALGGIGVAVRTTSVGTTVGTSDGVGDKARVTVASTARIDTCAPDAGTRVAVTEDVPVALVATADATTVLDTPTVAVDPTGVAVEATATTLPTPDGVVETGAVVVG